MYGHLKKILVSRLTAFYAFLSYLHCDSHSDFHPTQRNNSKFHSTSRHLQNYLGS